MRISHDLSKSEEHQILLSLIVFIYMNFVLIFIVFSFLSMMLGYTFYHSAAYNGQIHKKITSSSTKALPNWHSLSSIVIPRYFPVSISRGIIKYLLKILLGIKNCFKSDISSLILASLDSFIFLLRKNMVLHNIIVKLYTSPNLGSLYLMFWQMSFSSWLQLLIFCLKSITKLSELFDYSASNQNLVHMRKYANK